MSNGYMKHDASHPEIMHILSYVLDALKKDVRRTNLFRRCGLIQEYRLLVGSVSC